MQRDPVGLTPRPARCPGPGRGLPRLRGGEAGEFRIERSERIRGSADAVFARVDDLREFNSWNPFAAADPSANIVYPGKTRGAGAVYEWDSQGKSSKGRTTVVESQAARKVTRLRTTASARMQASHPVFDAGETRRVALWRVGD